MRSWSKVERSYRRSFSRIAFHLKFTYHPLLAIEALGKDAVAGEIDVSAGVADNYARQRAEKHAAAILMTSLDRQAGFRADKAAEIYLARLGMNPMALCAVLQKMTALGSQSASFTGPVQDSPTARYAHRPHRRTREWRAEALHDAGLIARHFTSRRLAG